MRFQKYANGIETDDSESEEIAGWNKRSNGMSDTDSYSEGVVPRTYTPPLKKKRGRKYASMRKHETDVEDYFSDTSEEDRWADRMNIKTCGVSYE